MHHPHVAVLLVRLVFGIFLACHGYNKVFGGGGLKGTAKWFGSMGMKWPVWQARIAATTEIGAGLMFAAGLLTPLAAAGIIGLMLVAIWTSHRKVGFFVFRPGQGWEYCASIAAVAVAVSITGPGRFSLDHVITFNPRGWISPLIAVALGVGGGILQLLVSYRPPADS